MFQLPPNDFYSWCVQIRVPDIPVLQMRRWRHQVTQLVSSELEFECRLPSSRAPFSNIVIQHRQSTQHVGAAGRLFLHVPTPSPTPSSSSLVPFSIVFPFHPSPSGTSHRPRPQLQSQLSPEVPHLKLVQRNPGQMGVAAPTGIEQQAYSSGTGDWQRRVTLVPTWGAPSRWQDGGAGGTGGGDTG